MAIYPELVFLHDPDRLEELETGLPVSRTGEQCDGEFDNCPPNFGAAAGEVRQAVVRRAVTSPLNGNFIFVALGDILSVVCQEDDWLWGTTTTGRCGWVPLRDVNVLPDVKSLVLNKTIL